MYITQEQLEHVHILTSVLQASQNHVPTPCRLLAHPPNPLLQNRRGFVSQSIFPQIQNTPSTSNQPLPRVSVSDVQRFSLGWSNWFWNSCETQVWIRPEPQWCKTRQAQWWAPVPDGVKAHLHWFSWKDNDAKSIFSLPSLVLRGLVAVIFSGHSRVNWSTKYLQGWWRIKYLTQIVQCNSCYPGRQREKQGGVRELFIFLPLRSALNNSPTSLRGWNKIIRTKMSEQSTGPLYLQQRPNC